MPRRLLAALAAVSVAGAGLVRPAEAAIDDAGMKYVSGGEGLGGSIRFRLHKYSTDFVDSSVEDFRDGDLDFSFGSSRVYMNGDIQLDSGWSATYYLEVRPEQGGEPEGAGGPYFAGSRLFGEDAGSQGSSIQLESQDIGLMGPFGWFRMGRIETASAALLPSADRTNDVGTTGNKLADYYSKGLRWTSPDLRGLKLGASLRVKDTTSNYDAKSDSSGIRQSSTRDNTVDQSEGNFHQDKEIDEWDVAVVYRSQQGLGVGVSLARKIEADSRDADASGFRVGASYERNTWGLSYNFHRYTAYNPFGLEPGNSPGQNSASGNNDTTRTHYTEFNPGNVTVGFGERLPNGVESGFEKLPNESLIRSESVRLRGNSDTEYTEHVIGGNFSLGKVNAALNYSVASTANERVDVSANPGLQQLDYRIKSIRADLGYRLGSKAKLIAAWRSDQHDSVPDHDIKSYYLMYRVDF